MNIIIIITLAFVLIGLVAVSSFYSNIKEQLEQIADRQKELERFICGADSGFSKNEVCLNKFLNDVALEQLTQHEMLKELVNEQTVDIKYGSEHSSKTFTKQEVENALITSNLANHPKEEIIRQQQEQEQELQQQESSSGDDYSEDDFTVEME